MTTTTMYHIMPPREDGVPDWEQPALCGDMDFTYRGEGAYRYDDADNIDDAEQGKHGRAICADCWTEWLREEAIRLPFRTHHTHFFHWQRGKKNRTYCGIPIVELGVRVKSFYAPDKKGRHRPITDARCALCRVGAQKRLDEHAAAKRAAA